MLDHVEVATDEGDEVRGSVSAMVLEHAVVLGEQGGVSRHAQHDRGTGCRPADDLAPARTALPLAVLERQQILDVLAEVGWHRGRAASRLGISPRTLYRKLRTFGVSRR